MAERILLFGPPDTGKTTQLINTIKYLEDLKTKFYVLDLEDKFQKTLKGMGLQLKNLKAYTVLTWEELGKASGEIESVIKPGEWVGVDRIDKAWSYVQNWYTEQKYKEALAEVMLEKAKRITKSFMIAPRFDQGSWQVINQAYDDWFSKLIYRTRANALITTGVKTDDNPIEMFMGLKCMPRGQKELGHQPHSVFLLGQQKVGRNIVWNITTAKDIPNRTTFDNEELLDFALQYIAQYYDPTEV